MGEDSDRKVATVDSFGESAEGYRDSETHRAGSDLDAIASWCADATLALDVATGAGHTAGALLDAGVPDVVASDASPAMVATSVDSFPDVEGVVADAERLPFATDAFDAVTCRIAAHHFPDPRAFLAEVARVVRPGGTFAFEDNVAPDDEGLATFLNSLEAMRDGTHVESYAAGTWREWIEAAGFAVTATEATSKRLQFGPWIDRRRAVASEDEPAIRRYVQEAPEAALDYFDVRFEDGTVESFENPKTLIRAERLP